MFAYRLCSTGYKVHSDLPASVSRLLALKNFTTTHSLENNFYGASLLLLWKPGNLEEGRRTPDFGGKDSRELLYVLGMETECSERIPVLLTVGRIPLS